MHPRNPYRDAPNFVSLADVYPPLKPHLISTPNGTTVDFHKEASQRCLTEALLRRDFDLKTTIPEDRLCPPVPNRLNYILWLQDILDTTYLSEPSDPNRAITGLDIGTGASVIYPLLGCRSRPQWRFVATDVDEKSLQYAQLNIRNNDLQDRIHVVKSSSDGPVIRHVLAGEAAPLASTLTSETVFDFTMCNPPFYGSRDDVQRSAEAKAYQPNAVCTGADVEMITPGGEAAFVRKMFSESLKLQSRCRWYTSMLGKLSSLTEVIMLLRESGIDNYAVTEFVQGQTRRWAIAWSFGDVRLPDSIARIPNQAIRPFMPAHNTIHQPFPQTISLNRLSSAITSVLASIDGVSTQLLPLCASDFEESIVAGVDMLVAVATDTWSRAARRRRMHEAAMQVDPQSAPALTCRIGCVTHRQDGPAERKEAGFTVNVEMQCHWVKGTDRGLFESFSSHLSRKVLAALSDI